MISEKHRLKLVGTHGEQILLLMLKLEEGSPEGITMTQIKVAADKSHLKLGDANVYKAACALRSIGFLRSAPFRSIAEGEARLAAARIELAKSPPAININSLRLTYELTELGRRAGLFLLGQRSAIDSIVKHGLGEATREELEIQVGSERKAFYRKLCNRLLSKSAHAIA